MGAFWGKTRRLALHLKIGLGGACQLFAAPFLSAMPLPMRLFTLLMLGSVLAMPMAANAQRLSADSAPSSFLGESAPAPMAAPRTSVATGVSEGIVAVVNDSVITTADLRGRMALALLSAGMPDSAEIRQRLFPQVLRTLIDEQLQQQEGKKLDVSVSDAEINDALKRIADDNHIPGGDMVAFVTAHGVSATALKAQVRAGLTWAKVVQRELRPKIDIGDDEVDAILQRQQANAGKDEYLLNEIFLPVENARDEEQVKTFADNLVKQIKEGAVFAAVARQFSQGASAASGGDMGWIQEGQLGPEIDQALHNMQPNEVKGPIWTGGGFHILGLRSKRTIAPAVDKSTEMKLMQAFHLLSPNDDKDDVFKQGQKIAETIKSCQDLAKDLAKFPGWQPDDLGRLDPEKAPSLIAATVRDMKAGDVSAPIPTDKGVAVLYVCERQDHQGSVDRMAITNQLGQEKIELAARRLLRDLRRAAYIEIKGHMPQ